MDHNELQAMIWDAVRENVREAVTVTLVGYQPDQPHQGPPGPPGPQGPPGQDRNDGNGNGNTKTIVRIKPGTLFIKGFMEAILSI